MLNLFVVLSNSKKCSLTTIKLPHPLNSTKLDYFMPKEQIEQ